MDPKKLCSWLRTVPKDILSSAAPRWEINGYRVYEAAALPAIRVDTLVYFALSVFWRAAVHTWKTPGGDVKIELGPYEEAIRLYLLDKSKFPVNVIVTIRVSNFHQLLWPPTEKRRPGFRMFTFGIPGLVFDMAAGAKIPTEFYTISTQPNPLKFVWMVQAQDDLVFSEFVSTYRQALSRTYRRQF